MKIPNTIKMTALLIAGSFSVAQAATYSVHLTGLTAFRGATMNAVANILTNPVASYAGGSLSGANQATFSGTIGADTYNIYTSWSGSETGVAHVSQTTLPIPPVTFLSLSAPQGVVTKATAPTTITGGTQFSSASSSLPSGTTGTEDDVADIAMSDGWQASTPFHGTQNSIAYTGLTGTSINGLPLSVVGVVPFKFVASAHDSAGNSYLPTTLSGNLSTTIKSTAATLDAPVTGLKVGSIVSASGVPFGTTVQAVSGTSVTLSGPASVTSTVSVPATFSYAGFSNMTDQLAVKTFTSANGSLPKLSQFSGSSDDSGITVVPVGRNHDSGTRTAFVLCTGIDKPGTAATAVQQYYPLDIDGNIVGTTGAGTTIVDKELVPGETINGNTYTVGQSGYVSGGNVAKVFTATNSLPNVLFVSYPGLNDAKTALGGNAQEMSYEGFYYSPTAVQQGQYTFWTYEHLYYSKSLKGGSKTVAQLVAHQIATSDATVSGLLIDSNFKVGRFPSTKDGVTVTP